MILVRQKTFSEDNEKKPGKGLMRAGAITAGLGAAVGATGYAVSKNASLLKHGIKGKAIRSMGGKYAMAAAPIIGLAGAGMMAGGAVSNKKDK